MTVAQFLALAAQLYALQQRWQNAGSTEEKFALAGEIAALIDANPQLKVLLGNQQITAEDIARDLETLNLTQG